LFRIFTVAAPGPTLKTVLEMLGEREPSMAMELWSKLMVVPVELVIFTPISLRVDVAVEP